MPGLNSPSAIKVNMKLFKSATAQKLSNQDSSRPGDHTGKSPFTSTSLQQTCRNINNHRLQHVKETCQVSLWLLLSCWPCSRWRSCSETLRFSIFTVTISNCNEIQKEEAGLTIVISSDADGQSCTAGIFVGFLVS